MSEDVSANTRRRRSLFERAERTTGAAAPRRRERPAALPTLSPEPEPEPPAPKKRRKKARKLVEADVEQPTEIAARPPSEPVPPPSTEPVAEAAAHRVATEPSIPADLGPEPVTRPIPGRIATDDTATDPVGLRAPPSTPPLPLATGPRPVPPVDEPAYVPPSDFFGDFEDAGGSAELQRQVMERVAALEAAGQAARPVGVSRVPDAEDEPTMPIPASARPGGLSDPSIAFDAAPLSRSTGTPAPARARAGAAVGVWLVVTAGMGLVALLALLGLGWRLLSPAVVPVPVPVPVPSEPVAPIAVVEPEPLPVEEPVEELVEEPIEEPVEAEPAPVVRAAPRTRRAAPAATEPVFEREEASDDLFIDDEMLELPDEPPPRAAEPEADDEAKKGLFRRGK